MPSHQSAPETLPIELAPHPAPPSIDPLPPSTLQDDEAPPQTYPRGITLLLITIGLILSIFIAALDVTIVATAIPSITTQFGSISNIAWYGSAYSVTNAAFKPPWGKAYQCFPLKTTFLLAIFVFELGNVICACAPRSEVLILGRCVAGLGGGGVMVGAFIMIALTAGPEYRAAYMGILGVTFGCASVVGPVLGGALTDRLGWRWCFWISLPFGFAAALMMFICFKSPLTLPSATLRSKLLSLDLNGAILLSGSLSCFVLAMHWTGIQSWTSARVIGSFVGFAGLLLGFIANEWSLGPKAMVQAHLLTQPRIFANLCYIFFLAGAFFPLLYTLPIQFQSVNAASASQSGLRLIPLVMGVSVFTMVSNGLLTFWRHYKPILLIGALLTILGTTKIYTLNATTPTRTVVAYELLTATGVGLALQIPMIANQALVPAADMPAVTALSLFIEGCGTALFIASGEAAFTNGLLTSLARTMSDVDARAVLDAGATQIRSLFHGAELEHVLGSYLNGCRTSYLVSVACGAVAGLVSLSSAGPAGVRWVRSRVEKARAYAQ